MANGDVQMNISQMAQNPNIRIFFPAGPNGQRSTFALPYYISLVHGAPHATNGKKLIDFLLTKDAQSTVSEVAQGLPVRDRCPPERRHLQADRGPPEGRDDLDARLGRGAEEPAGRREALARRDRQLGMAAG